MVLGFSSEALWRRVTSASSPFFFVGRSSCKPPLLIPLPGMLFVGFIRKREDFRAADAIMHF
jgi:hypothetical protein